LFIGRVVISWKHEIEDNKKQSLYVIHSLPPKVDKLEIDLKRFVIVSDPRGTNLAPISFKERKIGDVARTKHITNSSFFFGNF
jgi:hypothetical protein